MGAPPLFALIDCNNFFASCEQIFRPGLVGKPVVILSCNDGCVIARSAEARALGIPMGVPAFKWRQVFEKHGVIQFSANFELYGDISRRITEILTGITPRLEAYSIDESFLDISQLDITDYTEWATHVRQKIYQWVGIAVSVGVAPSKTLAKLASEHAKIDPTLGGVLVLQQTAERQQYLAASRVEDIWGIGRKLAPRLRALGLATALDIAALAPLRGRQVLGSVNGERLVRELNGQSCLPLERTHVDQKLISASRTFGHDTNQQQVVESALASFVARTSQRLRTSRRNARHLTIFVSTDRHKPGFRRWSQELVLNQPTADTGTLIECALKLFKDIYEIGVLYHRAGVLLSDFISDNSLQTDLLDRGSPQVFERSLRRMKAVDELHARYGKQVAYYATEKLDTGWLPRANTRSPGYTTAWADLPQITKLE